MVNVPGLVHFSRCASKRAAMSSSLTDKCIILTRRDTTCYAHSPGQVLPPTFDRPIP